jgi:hypothetical protein
MVPMIVLVWLALAATLVAVVVFGARFKRRRGTPEDLRGDWWPRFETEFRAYASRFEEAGGGPPGRSRRSRPPERSDLAEGV